MKILLFIDSLGAGGAQRQLVGLAVMLQEKGYNVKVCTYYNIDFYKQYLDNNRVPNELIFGADNTKKRIFAIKKYFSKENPDWVIAYQETPSLVACTAKLLGCKYKLIVSERNTTQHVGMNERIRFFLYHWADAIVPNSYCQENYLAEHHPWMKSRLKTITNFVDLDVFPFVEHHKQDTPEIIIPASLMPSKNPIEFIKSCALLKEQGLKFHVSWYGISNAWKEYHERCVKLITALGLNDNIDILEKTKEIGQKYEEADFLCLPSHYEGTPNVICEAISTGLPVACSNICDNSIYVKEEINGILFNPSSPSDIANKLQIILTLPDEKYQEFRKASRSIAERKLQKDVFLKKYIDIIQS